MALEVGIKKGQEHGAGSVPVALSDNYRDRHNKASASARELEPLRQDAERAWRRGHKETIAACNQSLDIFSIGMGMTAGNVVFFANS